MGKHIKNNTHKFATFKSLSSSLVLLILKRSKEKTEYIPTSISIIPIKKIISKKLI
tara:strand:- start:309 stop:476 length:168 start_codon:yes stop_codon:yes gene_type:complete